MKKYLIFAACIFLPLCTTQAENWKILLDFRGNWKIKLGDDAHWSEKNFDDSKWNEIFVPANWEDEGYPGYDGYAWYRKHFQISSQLRNKPLYLNVGYVDDVSEVYLNGHFISFTGSFPPNYETAYNVEQRFPVPEGYLNFDDDNVLTVRVYDDEGGGGINRGKPGVYEMTDYFYPDYTIAGTWKLNRGDNPQWAEPTFDDSKWNNVAVPAHWETQGLKDYDGFAWYRIHFTVPENLRNQDVVLLLGKIDDVDEAYLNGERIGHTGSISRAKRSRFDDDYLKLRVYTVPAESFRTNVNNVLAVRVYDGFRDGGIYDGPIGIVTRTKYLQWKKNNGSEWKNPVDKFFDFLDRNLK